MKKSVVVLIDRDDDKPVCILQFYSRFAARLRNVTTQQEVWSVVFKPDSKPPPGRSLHGILLRRVAVLMMERAR